MASSDNGTCPRDLLQGLVAGTSPLMCADLNYLNYAQHILCKGYLFTKQSASLVINLHFKTSLLNLVIPSLLGKFTPSGSIAYSSCIKSVSAESYVPEYINQCHNNRCH